MKLKSIIALLSLALLPAFANASVSTPIELDALPIGSGFEIVSHDEATGVWTMRVVTNDGGALVPSIGFKPIAAPVDAQCRALSFDYITTEPSSLIQMVAFKVFLGTATQDYIIDRKMTVKDDWQPLRYYVGELRDKNSCRFLNKAGQYQNIKFYDLPVGAEVQFRNFRYEEDEVAFRDVTLSATDAVVIEAEDFNDSASGTLGVISRQIDGEPRVKYRNPTGNQFPILAWCSIDYDQAKGTEFFEYQLHELVECGFNVTLGSGHGNMDLNLLYDDREFEGRPYAPCKDLDLWVMVKTGLDDWRCEMTTNNSRWSSKLAGFFIKDEPQYMHIPEMQSKVRTIRRVDPDHMVYVNNFSSEVSRNLGFEFEDFLSKFIRETGADYISYDIYPVRQYEDTGEIFLIPQFLESLEIATRVGKYFDMPVWGFVHSVESNCAVAGVRYPTPTEPHMRVQAFGNLAYGCQAIQYFTYKCPYDPSYNYTESPISLDNQRTDTWYMVQNINREIQALKWVFLGAKFISAGQTNEVTPLGCIRLTPEMLPEQVSAIASDGQGICVTQLQNGSNRFLMAVNLDLHNAQEVSYTTTKDVKRVLPDGSTEVIAAGSHTVSLPTGGYLLLLTDENAAPLVESVASTNVKSDYRPVTNVVISENTDASGGYYLPDMGDARWDVYVLPRQDFDGHVISREKAVENWGSAFEYDINVPEDMEVNISIGHSVPEQEYDKVTSVGLAPGYQYIVSGEESLNWPQEYAASMILSVDGEAVPTTAGSDVLHFLPRDNFGYNALPDYEKVALSAGTHRLTVTSLCYPWHFDTIKIEKYDPNSVDAVAVDPNPFMVKGLRGIIAVEGDQPFKVYNAAGIIVADGEGSAKVNIGAGIYVVAAADGRTARVAVK